MHMVASDQHQQCRKFELLRIERCKRGYLFIEAERGGHEPLRIQLWARLTEAFEIYKYVDYTYFQ
jgi:hypothetical protein